MAKRKRGIKSQAVRELLTKNPAMTAREIVTTLAERRIKIKPNLVYFLKGKMTAGTQRRKKIVRAARAATAASMNGDPATLIRDVKALAARSGGIERLKDLVEALSE